MKNYYSFFITSQFHLIFSSQLNLMSKFFFKVKIFIIIIIFFIIIASLIDIIMFKILFIFHFILYPIHHHSSLNLYLH
jgi:hypothetical protein